MTKSRKVAYLARTELDSIVHSWVCSNFKQFAHSLHPSSIHRALLIVKKTTGGRAWLPKWGFSGLSRCQKANRRKNLKEERQLISALRLGAANQPLLTPKPQDNSTTTQH
jgi:hypothetical protein